ncbi:MAG: DNA-binding protein [Candidatus Abyssobacteria bacterium SURF_5]|uniref:DNA-binding protein n=1 Tax=Abyssobacteria bacterium (strain SURF_5) TaxID=2093360 RepID=A0A3A4P428_ABYX5|nr:MAG: DNA-binding protein [Candidatus Abyssubacteria bacterium SURF_5]
MKKAIIAGFAIIIALAFTADASAQQMRRGCWGRADRYNRLYDPDTVVTVSGTVTDIDYFQPSAGMAEGVHLFLRQPDGTPTEVHLGPRWYIENQDISIDEGDFVEVTGSRIMFEGEPVVIASSLRMDGQVLRLRDRQGYPLWAGWRREAN